MALPALSAHGIEFENATQSAGVGGNVGESYGASWGDFNGDGYPDLFSDNHREFGRLWRNNGDGTFADVSTSADASAVFGPQARSEKDTHGAAWADLNGDGLQDLVTTVSTQNAHYLISNGTTLTDQGPAMGLVLGHNNGSRGPIAFDPNNDGLLDLKVVGTRETASNLFRQGAPGSYSLISGSGGATCPPGTQWAQLMDFDANGTLEMACGDGSRFPRGVVDFSSGQGQPYTFGTTSRSRDGVVGDFNNDQRQDLLHVLGAFRINELTQVGSNMVEVTGNITAGMGTRTIRLTTTGSISVDLDADNWNFVINRGGSTQDVYIGASGAHPASLDLNLAPNGNNIGIAPTNGRAGMFIGYVNGEWQLRISNTSGFNIGYFQISSTAPISNPSITTVGGDAAFVPRLQLSTAGGFVDATAGSGLTAERCISGAAADFDNDMDLDVFLGCRGGSSNIENVVFENQGDGTFVKVTGHGGEGITGASLANQAGQTESVVLADYDADGFVDVFVTNGLNLYPLRTGGPTELFRNTGNSNNWVELDLKGTASNIDGVGAIVRVTAGGVTQYREQNGGYHRWSQNHSRIHVGLAGNTTADVTIEWPSGQVDSYPGVSANTLYLATENQSLVPRFGAVGDTDGDGLSDTDEVNIYGTDPLLADTDGGGVNDGREVAFGTDALAAGDDLEPSCALPPYNAGAELGYFVGQDCGFGGPGRRYQVRVTGGGTNWRRYLGVLTANQPLSPIGVALENADVLNSSTTTGNVDFRLGVSNFGVDGFSVVIPDGAGACLTPLTADIPIVLGGQALVFDGPLSLDTLGPCP